MPVDPRELVRGGLSGVITEDRLCDRCRYNLKGLPKAGRCPECGLPIRRRSSGKRYTDNLTQAPIFYLKTLALGLGLTAAASLLFILNNVTSAFAPATWALGLLAINAVAAILWWMGVFIATAQRPLTETTIRDSILESRQLRQANRSLQASWAVGVLFTFLQMRSGQPVVGYLAHGAITLGTLSLVPLALHFSALADWAGDTGVSERFKVSAWAMAFFGVAKQVGWAATATGATGVAAAVVWFWCSLAEAIAQGLFLFGLFQLVANATWAINNASHAADAARRIADRKEDPTAHLECAYCGYSRQGISPFAPCPECGRMDESARHSGVAAVAASRRHERPPEQTPEIPLEPASPPALPAHAKGPPPQPHRPRQQPG